MELFFLCYAFLLGLIIGSFLNVLIYRIPLKLSAAKGFSFCPSCRHRLSLPDLVPVFSFLFLRGKCRYCKARISPRYPAIELLTAVLFALVYRIFGLQPLTFVYAAAVSALIVLAAIDFEHKLIPDRLNIVLAACAVLAGILSRDIGWAERIIGFFAVSVPVLILVLTIGGMGEGDVKLFAVLGLLLGWKMILLTLLLASVAAAFYALILVARGRAGKKSEIPFGPFIALGAVISLLAGKPIIGFYLSLLP